jgi:hypothetical protein
VSSSPQGGAYYGYSALSTRPATGADVQAISRLYFGRPASADSEKFFTGMPLKDVEYNFYSSGDNRFGVNVWPPADALPKGAATPAVAPSGSTPAPAPAAEKFKLPSTIDVHITPTGGSVAVPGASLLWGEQAIWKQHPIIAMTGLVVAAIAFVLIARRRK